MANENDQELDNNSGAEDKLPNEDISKWQDGLQNPEDEDTNPVKSSKQNIEHNWVKEVEDSSEKNEISQEKSEADEEIIDNTLPDWLNELSEIDSSTTESSSTHEKEMVEENLTETDPTEEPMPGSEVTEKIEIDPSNFEGNTEISPPSIRNKPSEEGFIEISEFDTPEDSENELLIADNDLSEAEELPQWLEEMIAESDDLHLDTRVFKEATDIDKKEDSSFSQEKPSRSEMPDENMEELSDEPTQPVDITQENILANETVKVETSTEIESFDEVEIQPAHSEPEKSDDLKEPITTIEEPAVEPVHEIIEEQPEKLYPEQDEIPLELQRAKSLLDQGDYTLAMEVIHTYIDRKEFLTEIQSWLDDLAHDSAPSNSDIWEAIGDIALIQKLPEKALNAYTEAIKSLLIIKEDHNAIG